MHITGGSTRTSPDGIAVAAVAPATGEVALVIARDPRLRLVVRKTCGQAGMTTVEAWNLDSAQQQLSRSETDLVVMALSDPIALGLEAVEALRSSHPALYIIALTDGTGAEEVE